MSSTDADRREAEQLAVVKDRQDRRDDGVWIRWGAGVLVVLSVGALSTVVNLSNKVTAIEIKEEMAQAQRAEITVNMRAQAELYTSLNATMIRLTSKVDEFTAKVTELLEDRRDLRPSRPRAVFPDGHTGTFDK